MPTTIQRLAAIAAFAATALAVPVTAKVITFSAHFVNTNPPAAPGGRCPALTVSIGNFGVFHATGTSSAGNYTAVQSHCLNSGPPVAAGAPAVPYSDGLFAYSFAGGATLTGTYTGLLTNSGVTGVIDNVQNFVITGGSGVFGGASGSFVGTGDLRFAGGPPSATLNIANAQITVPGVPEPTSWAMLIAGFGLTGAVLRRRALVAVAA